MATAIWMSIACALREREHPRPAHPSTPNVGASGCEAGRADCDGDPTNGCEIDLASDVSHCGSCDVTCSHPSVASALCVGARCKIDACAGDFGDCDGLVDNGCEGHACSTSHGPDCRAKCEKPAYGYEF